VKFVETNPGAGRGAPEPVPGTEYQVACDMVIPALGQSRLTAMLPVEASNGMIVVDRPTGRTSNPKYYAGGDCVNGGREVVDAVADGKRAAQGILSHA
jgi:glutamate synthase (NADPH/NADH) small chain